LYHWVRTREATIDLTFSEIEIANERALDRTAAGARMTFGLGPAIGGGNRGVRSREIFNALQPGLRGYRWARQVHGIEVAVIGREADGGVTESACVGSCDAMVTDQRGVGLMVWTADCVPVLLEGPGVVAAIHSGWRGTAADIVRVVIRRLESEYGVTPDQLSAALGPAITGPHYEVGHDVVDSLRSIGIGGDEWLRGNHVDLRLFLAARLGQLGVPHESIGVIGPCTFSTTSLASYRRDGSDAGRQFSLVYLRRGEEGATGDVGRRPRS